MGITTGGVPQPSLHVEGVTGTTATSSASAPAEAYSPQLRDSLASNLGAGHDALLAATLAQTLKNLDESIAAVSWPSAASGSSSASSSDSDAAAKADATETAGGYNLDSPTSLAPGAYTLDYLGAASSQGQAPRVAVYVYGGDTWGDVLARLSQSLGSASPAMLRRLVSVRENPVPAARRTASVSEAQAASLADSVGGVLAAGNAVGDLLSRHADSFAPGAAKAWAALGGDVSSVGVRRTGGALWLSQEDFLAALYADPEGTRERLAGAGGLFAALASGAEALRAGGVQSSTGETKDAGDAGGVLAAPSGVRTEAEAEKSSRLVDRYDRGTDFFQNADKVEGAGGLLRRRG